MFQSPCGEVVVKGQCRAPSRAQVHECVSVPLRGSGGERAILAY
jgi:hypothetical protein